MENLVFFKINTLYAITSEQFNKFCCQNAFNNNNEIKISLLFAFRYLS